jgi:hypothetical protein
MFRHYQLLDNHLPGTETSVRQPPLQSSYPLAIHPDQLSKKLVKFQKKSFNLSQISALHPSRSTLFCTKLTHFCEETGTRNQLGYAHTALLVWYQMI